MVANEHSIATSRTIIRLGQMGMVWRNLKSVKMKKKITEKLYDIQTKDRTFRWAITEQHTQDSGRLQTRWSCGCLAHSYQRNLEISRNIIIFIAQFPKNASSQAGHYVQDQVSTFAAVIIYDSVLFYWKMCCFSSVWLAPWICNWIRFPILFVVHSLFNRLLKILCDTRVGLAETPLSTMWQMMSQAHTAHTRLGSSKVWYLTNCMCAYAPRRSHPAHTWCETHASGTTVQQKIPIFPRLIVTHILSAFCFSVRLCSARDSQNAVFIISELNVPTVSEENAQRTQHSPMQVEVWFIIAHIVEVIFLS